MPFKNTQLFFSNALGWKQVTQLSQEGALQPHWVTSDYGTSQDEETILNKQLLGAFCSLLNEYDLGLSDTRKIIYQLFMTVLQNKTPPIFTKESIAQSFNIAEEQLDLMMGPLESVELTCLAQAIVDDDRKTVEAMLQLKPELLLSQCHVIVTSEYTGQQFGVDGNFLGLACRRKQIEMVKIIMPHFDRLLAKLDEEDIAEIQEIKNAGLAQWLKYPLDSEKNIQIPEDYQALVGGLIDLFKAENIAPNTPVKILSDTVETAMNVLYERLLPGITNSELAPENRRVMTKENHLDVELLLFAAYTAYSERFEEFQTWEQRNAYCIRVIGIVQNFLSPETGKIFCEGLYYVVEENRKISPRAEGLKLADGTTNFYGPLDLVLRRGLGFDCLCGSGGTLWQGGAEHRRWLGKVGQTKTTAFRNLLSDTSTQHISRAPSIITPGV